jgi:hypothetical protein
MMMTATMVTMIDDPQGSSKAGTINALSKIKETRHAREIDHTKIAKLLSSSKRSICSMVFKPSHRSNTVLDTDILLKPFPDFCRAGFCSRASH